MPSRAHGRRGEPVFFNRSVATTAAQVCRSLPRAAHLLEEELLDALKQACHWLLPLPLALVACLGALRHRCCSWLSTLVGAACVHAALLPPALTPEPGLIHSGDKSRLVLCTHRGSAGWPGIVVCDLVRYFLVLSTCVYYSKMQIELMRVQLGRELESCSRGIQGLLDARSAAVACGL
jgi:hypothetical protein